MRLLVVSQHFWPENFRINDLVTELVKRGNEVTVLTGLPNYPDGKIFAEFARDPGRYNRYEGAKIVRVPVAARGQSRIRLALNFLAFAVSGSFLGPWKLRHESYDAIFVFAPSPITVVIPAIVLKWFKSAPLACWVLDLWPETLQAVGALRGKFALASVGSLVSFIYRHCNLILVQSRSFIPQVARYCVDASRILYFPNWAESAFATHEVPLAPEVPRQPGSFDIMFAGNIGVAQDFPSILAAAELLAHDRRIRWLIVGDGRMAAWVNEQIVKRNLATSVLMLGKYPVDRMPSFYRHAAALLVSLRDEPIFAMTIPGKLQSYLAAGIPVIAMLNGEGAELVQRTGSGVVCAAGNYRDLAAAVSKLASLPAEERAAMARNARLVSKAEFDRDTLITQLEFWLQRMASESPGNLVPPSR